MQKNSSNADISSSPNSEIAIPRRVRFWLILFVAIPSTACSLFALYYLLTKRALRLALNNHVMIVLLIIGVIFELTHISWTLVYYHLGTVWPATPTFCIIWMFFDETCYVMASILVAWATIERHILIFHVRWMSTKKQRFFIHYLPLALLIVYCFTFYVVIIFLPPCKNKFEYSQLLCGHPLCYFDTRAIATYDILVHDLLPTALIIFCSLTLLLRVLWQKYLIHQAIHWRKNRRMTIQLLSISILYLFIYIPEMLMDFAYLCGVPKKVGADFMLYSKFFSVYVILLFPFVCTGSLHELRAKINKKLSYCRRKTNSVASETLTIDNH